MFIGQSKITIEELKTYLYSVESEEEQTKEEEIEDYKIKCEETNVKVKTKEIQKIKKAISKQYKEKIESKDNILSLLDECAEIPRMVEKLSVAKYMVYRANVRSAENVLTRAEKKIGKRYQGIVAKIEDELDNFPDLDSVEEIDFGIYKPDKSVLEEAKKEYAEDYTEEERKALIQNELNIIAKAKIFNTTPMPHEILKNSDRDIQSKMQKFNSIRQKRLRILNTMEEDYAQLEIPREINAMVDDAILYIEVLNDVLTKSEYNKVKNSLIRKRKKIYRSTNELRSIIKTKEKKTGIVYYNIQEARYSRMETLRDIINEANSVINANAVPGAEEKLKKLISAYEKEKQYASVIEKLEEEAGNKAVKNSELEAYEEQIQSIESKINNFKEVKKVQEEKIQKAKKELVILWKMEIDNTISKRKETFELPETTITNDVMESTEDIVEEETKGKGVLTKLKKLRNGKHACV